MLVIFLVIIMAVSTVAELAGPALQGLAIDTIEADAEGNLSLMVPDRDMPAGAEVC